MLQKGGPVLVCHGKDGAGMVVIKRWDKWGLKHPPDTYNRDSTGTDGMDGGDKPQIVKI